MAWNEPGNNNGKDKDPWGSNQQDSNQQGNRPDKGPPDLDEVLNNITKKFNEFFGGTKNRNSQRRGGNPVSPKTTSAGFAAILFVLAGIWFISGFYTVAEAELGVVTRFGKFYTIKHPGLNWSPKFIDQKYIVNVRAIQTHDSAGLMLTKDENVVSVKMNVQYRIEDPEKYLFNVINADNSLEQVTDAALRGAIGDSTMDEVLTTGREQITVKTREEIERIMKPYDMGLVIVGNVNLQETRPPAEVQEAFDDAISAREDEEKYKRQAEAYSNDIKPKAQGRAARIIKEAEGYAVQVNNRAAGKVAQFKKLLPQYQAAPEVTKERLYLETMERVYATTSKVYIDAQSSNNMIYLPLDKLMGQSNSANTMSPSLNQAPRDLVQDKIDNHQYNPSSNSSDRNPARPTDRTTGRQGSIY